MEKLQKNGISTRPGTHAIHMLNYYKEKFNLNNSDFLGAQSANNFSMAIPLHNRMKYEDFQYVVDKIKNL